MSRPPAYPDQCNARSRSSPTTLTPKLFTAALALLPVFDAASCFSLSVSAPAIADTSRSAHTTTVVRVVTFNDQLHDFYWYGHRLRSPVVFTFDGQAVRGNGYAPEPIDTTGSSATLAPRYAGIPYVLHQVADGHTYLEAVNAYHCAVERVAQYLVRIAGQGAKASTPEFLRTNVSPSESLLIDFTRPAYVDAESLSLPLRGGKTLQRRYGRSDLARRPPCSRPDAATLADQVRSSIDAIQQELSNRNRAVVIATQVGYHVFTGTECDRVRSMLARARAAYARGIADSAEGETNDTKLIPRDLFLQILKNAGE